jgi:hypothetical protein
MMSWIVIVLADLNNILQVDMSLHLDTITFWANQSLLLLPNTTSLAEKQQMLIIYM